MGQYGKNAQPRLCVHPKCGGEIPHSEASVILWVPKRKSRYGWHLWDFSPAELLRATTAEGISYQYEEPPLQPPELSESERRAREGLYRKCWNSECGRRIAKKEPKLILHSPNIQKQQGVWWWHLPHFRMEELKRVCKVFGIFFPGTERSKQGRFLDLPAPARLM